MNLLLGFRFYKLGLVGLACLAVFWLVGGAGQEEGEAVPPPAISSRSQLAISKAVVDNFNFRMANILLFPEVHPVLEIRN